MKYRIPNALVSSINDGTWKNPGPDVLRHLLGADLPDLELFEDIDVMRQISDRLDAAGYVDDPEFCIVRETNVRANDPRLIFGHALFIGGSTIPGDDVFVVVDLGSDESDPPVLVFDWENSAPDRWVGRGKLSGLLEGLSR